MTTILGGVQQLDGDGGRWVARVTYAVAESELLPVAVEVRLRPPCPGHPDWRLMSMYDETGKRRRRRYFRDDAGEVHFEGDGLEPPQRPCDCPWPESSIPVTADVPNPGLPLALLRKVSYTADMARTREAFRNWMQYAGNDGPIKEVANAVLAEPDRPRVGRKRRDRRTVLRALALYEQGMRLDAIAKEVGYTRAWVKDALSWARNTDPPLLVGGRGRGARGGVMTPAALAEHRALTGGQD